jgi:phage host-nuclease inhibitor protein Gam
MADLTWQEISPETWQAEHAGRKAHVIKSGEGWFWYVDGGPLHPIGDEPPLDLDGAKAAAGAALNARTWHEQASADLGLPPAPPAPERPRPLAQRIAAGLSPKIPKETREALLADAERVGSFADAIRAFAEEGGDATVIAQMVAENAAAGASLVEAALEVRREHQTRIALAQAHKQLLQKQIEAARAEEKAAELAIDRIDENVIRPVCEAVGQGDTKAIRSMTGRVSIVKNRPSVAFEGEPDLDFLRALDEGLVRVTLAANKEAIAVALEQGREVPGAVLVKDRTRVEVRG